VENIKATLYFGISGLALLIGFICMIIAAVTAFADTVLWALSATYIQIAIVALLVAIWFGLLAIFIELKHQWEKAANK